MNREELERRLYPLIGICGPRHQSLICTRCDERLAKIMQLADAYADQKPSELWSAEEVARHLGQRGGAPAARSWLSRNGIERATTRRHPDSGRPQSLYSANHVRAVCIQKGIS